METVGHVQNANKIDLAILALYMREQTHFRERFMVISVYITYTLSGP